METIKIYCTDFGTFKIDDASADAINECRPATLVEKVINFLMRRTGVTYRTKKAVEIEQELKEFAHNIYDKGYQITLDEFPPC